MSYRWKPSASQKRAFAERMKNDAEYAEAYNERKQQLIEKRKSSSKFDYESAGGNYRPTQFQHNFCMEYNFMFVTSEEKDAANMVMQGWVCNEKVHHDFIHIVNEKIRSINKY